MNKRPSLAFFSSALMCLLLASCGEVSSSSSSGQLSSSSSQSEITSSSSIVVPEDAPSFLLQVNEIVASSYGDSIFVKIGDWDCLIDGGNPEDADNVKAMLREQVSDHKLDFYIATHAHADHVGVFSGNTYSSNIFSQSNITNFGYIVDSGSARNMSSYNSYKNVRDYYMTTASAGGTYIPAGCFFYDYKNYNSYKGQNVFNITGVNGTDNNPATIGTSPTEGIYLTILNSNSYLTPGTTSDDDPNTSSVCVLLTYYTHKFIFCGDATAGPQNGIMANYSYNSKPYLWSDEDDVYLKANHHGSDSNGSNSSVWVNWVNPDHVFISSAITENNKTSSGVLETQHPYVSPLRRFKNKTSDVYWNGINGTFGWKSLDGVNMSQYGSQKKIPFYYDGAVVSDESTTSFFKSKWCLTGPYSSLAESA